MIGPFRGGRVDAVAGDPTKPLVFYFGAVNGGVWKTVTAGMSWENITDGRSDISSVGALTVAPSDPNVIYVGTGESQLREDLTKTKLEWDAAKLAFTNHDVANQFLRREYRNGWDV